MRKPHRLYSHGYGRIPLGGIDPDLRRIVRDLNREGYKTEGSCSGGGEGHGSEDDCAFITFHEGEYFSSKDRRVIRSIVERYTSVPFIIKSAWPHSFIDFSEEVREESPLTLKKEREAGLSDSHFPTW